MGRDAKKYDCPPWIYTHSINGGARGKPGPNSARTRLVSPRFVSWNKNLGESCQLFSIMPSFCCVPECNQKGYKDEKNDKISYFNFPTDKTRRKQWLHAIRRDVGKDFRVTEKTKVCSRHFRSSDLKKSLNGRVYVKDNVVPSRFKWCPESPRKRKAPAARFPLKATTKTKPSTSTSTCSSLDSVNESETVQKANVYKPEQDAEDAMTEKLEEKMLSEDLKQKLLNKERELLDAENRVIALENENTLLREEINGSGEKT